jgi:hypothetical protein
MDMTASMHGPTLARDDRYAGPRAASSAAAAAQAAAAVARLRKGALHAGRPAQGTRVPNPDGGSGSGSVALVAGEGGVLGVGRKRPRPQPEPAASGAGADAVAAGPAADAGGMARGDYLADRAAKLSRQHAAAGGRLSGAGARGSEVGRSLTPAAALFAGMRFYIDGRTAGHGEEGLTALGLTAVIHRHGGATSLDAAVTRVTHILAHNLNGSKAHDLAHRAGAKVIPVLRPGYIAACVAAGRRLPEVEWSVLPAGSSGGGGAGMTLDGWRGAASSALRSGGGGGAVSAAVARDASRHPSTGCPAGGEVVIVLSGE